MKISEMMTKAVVTVNSEDKVKVAAELMREHDIGSIPVCYDGKIIGVITDRDIVIRTVADGKNGTEQTVRSIMTSTPVVASPDMDVKDAARIMSERQIRRLPVVREGKLVGIVSLGDFAVENNTDNCAEKALSGISSPCCPKI